MGFTPEQQARFSAVYVRTIGLNEHQKLVQSVDTMLKMLIDGGEAIVKRMDVKSVVPHPDNRGRAPMQVNAVYRKFSKIVGVGFALSKCDPSRAVAFQRSPLTDKQVMKFIDNTKDNPSFAKFDAKSVEALSVGCGHLNQALAATRDECKLPTAFLDDVDLTAGRKTSKLDAHELSKNDPILADALKGGLTWTVVHHSIELAYPKLPFLIPKGAEHRAPHR